jgi:hypothetical protein
MNPHKSYWLGIALGLSVGVVIGWAVFTQKRASAKAPPPCALQCEDSATLGQVICVVGEE